MTRPDALLVFPRLVELDRLFSETGSRIQEGRRLLLRRPSGFDLHSVREYEQGESLRRVHWPSTAKRGQLMVKDLEDSPRDEVARPARRRRRLSSVARAPSSSFETAVSAAGSILRTHVGRGRRVGLIVNALTPRYQAVHTLDGDWDLALELLASVDPDGRNAVTALLVEGAGAPSKALELCLVTSDLIAASRRPAPAALGHAAGNVGRVRRPDELRERLGGRAVAAADTRAQLARLEHAGIPVCVLRRGDDLAATLGAGLQRLGEARRRGGAWLGRSSCSRASRLW